MINEEKKPRLLYNPTLEDCVLDFNKLGDKPEVYILEAGTIKEFPDHIATLMEEKLAERMYWRNIPGNRNREKRMKELLGIIRV